MTEDKNGGTLKNPDNDVILNLDLDSATDNRQRELLTLLKTPNPDSDPNSHRGNDKVQSPAGPIQRSKLTAGQPKKEVNSQGAKKGQSQKKTPGLKTKKTKKITTKVTPSLKKDKKVAGPSQALIELLSLLALFGLGFILISYLSSKNRTTSPTIQDPVSPSPTVGLPVTVCPPLKTQVKTCPDYSNAPSPKSNPDIKTNIKENENVPKVPKDCLEIQRAASMGPQIYGPLKEKEKKAKPQIPGQDKGQGQRSKTSRQVIYPLKSQKKEVLCDFETDGGGWTIIQQRMLGAPHALFYRNWKDYEQGFGVNDTYWLGLEAIRALTMDENGSVTLRIELTDWSGETRWAQYESFKVESADDSYRLRICGYNGDAGDSLTYHNNQQFSTLDRNNDKKTDHEGPCAKTRHSGWWFDWCTKSNLNGLHWDDQYSKIYESISKGDGITWYTWKGPNYSLKSVTMKIRPANFKVN